jgi:hypothetical protein
LIASTESQFRRADYLRSYCLTPSSTVLVSELIDPPSYAGGSVDPLSGKIAITPDTSGAEVVIVGPRQSFAALAPGALTCWTEARVRISGFAAAQTATYYAASFGVSAAHPTIDGSSAWHSASPDWQVLKTGSR